MLDAEGIPYDDTPGVSSFCGAAAALNAEYTLPTVSQTVIITRMEGRTPVPEKEKLASLAAHGATMVIFLSIGLVDKVQQALLAGGAYMTPIDFLILDEHTAALDPKTAEIIMELTDQVVKEKKVTTIMVTHNLRYAVEYGNRLIMMHEGKAILDKAGEEKKTINTEEIMAIFNRISVECGN